MFRSLAVFLLVVLLVADVEAQVDSVTVTVVDRSTLSLEITTTTGGGGFGIPLTGAAGDTLTFEAIAIDTQTGDTVDVILRWESSGPAVVIDAVTGFARYVGGCGQVSCQVTISAFVRQIVSMLIFRQLGDGTWAELGADTLELEVGCVGWADDGVEVDGRWDLEPSCVEWGPEWCSRWADDRSCAELARSEPVQLCAELVDGDGVTFGDCPAELGPDGLDFGGIRGRPTLSRFVRRDPAASFFGGS